jgi:SAM-dependent methyltransferase
VIEHIFNTEFLGQEINRVLKRGGYAILNVPNHYALPYRINLLLGKGINRHQDIIEDWNYWHIRFFTWKSWNRYLKKMKFKIVEFYPVPIILNKLYLPEPIARKYPNLFSSRFLVKVVKM